jgi:two-component system chemotaxis response regulator CheB
MLGATDDVVERALWAAVRILEEKAALAARLSERMRSAGNARSSARFTLRAREASEQADAVRAVLAGAQEEAEAASG